MFSRWIHVVDKAELCFALSLNNIHSKCIPHLFYLFISGGICRLFVLFVNNSAMHMSIKHFLGSFVQLFWVYLKVKLCI